MASRSFFSIETLRALLNELLPARRSAHIVERLSLPELQRLAHVEARTGASVRYLLPYHDPRVRALVWECKYRRTEKALSLAGALLAEEVMANVAEEFSPPLLIPMPMHDTRRKARGYNQSELLCERIAEQLGDSLIYAPNILSRVRDAPAQQTLSRKKRLTNLVGSMHASPEAAGRTAIVIDDVTTTGASFEEARRALKEAGVRHVVCIALAG